VDDERAVSFAAPSEGRSDQELDELRRLLLGPERRRIDELARRIDGLGLSAEELAELLPEAIALRAGRDRKLARALAPTVEGALHESVRRNPRDIASAIFPVLGPAIRKAIAEAMSGLVHSINTAVEHSLSPQGLRWRFEAWRTGVPFAQVVIRHALVYRVEQVFLVHAETGLPLGHVALPDLATADADLVAGMLTAIQDFVRDSFHAEPGGELRTFQVGELTVLVEQGPRAVIAAVVRGEAPEALLRKLQDALETIHLRFSRDLAQFAGDAAPFVSAEPILAECLETVLHEEPPGRRRRASLRWALPLAAVLLVLAGLWFRAERRWQGALTRLRAEPGVMLVDADRSWGRWHLAGLRDPLAADPRALLAGIGVDTGRVEARFWPYLSLDRGLVLARARQVLGVPAAVTTSLRGDTLVVAGTAPIGWIARLGAAPGLPPGVEAVDLSQVSPVLPAGLDAIARDLEARRALFDVGSAAVTPAAGAEVDTVAAGFRRILDGASAPGYRIELELVGRADPTGTDAANLAVSRMRTDAITRRLVASGVPAGAIRGMAVATANPLAGPDSAATARQNRSVSFAVRVAPRAGTADAP
jgi:OOP family OmpA-OmpF porin